MRCRHCNDEVTLKLIDLGSAPLSNGYLNDKNLSAAEHWYPLAVLVCERCWLVQTKDFAKPDEVFDANYAYFSSFSDTWLTHSRNYVTDVIRRFGLTPESHVVEVASNDGYLLQYFKAHQIRCTGIEPTASTAAASRAKGIDTIEGFFGKSMAMQLVDRHLSADLIVANNVLAHVPDVNDFVTGFRLLLKPHGVATFEFPHLVRLIAGIQFDTIYHEHFSYLSLSAVETVFVSNGFSIFDVEEHQTHGGSLRVFAQHTVSGIQPVSSRVTTLLEEEESAGVRTRHYYSDFQAKAEQIKNDFISFLIQAKRAGKVVVAYGAAAKGNTFLNFAGIRSDLIAYVMDRNPAKQGKFMPGSRIPIVAETWLDNTRPDYVVILPWNIKAEVMEQLKRISTWGGRFVTAVPVLEIV